jgi:hypothetical protein
LRDKIIEYKEDIEKEELRQKMLRNLEFMIAKLDEWEKIQNHYR